MRVYFTDIAAAPCIARLHSLAGEGAGGGPKLYDSTETLVLYKQYSLYAYGLLLAFLYRNSQHYVTLWRCIPSFIQELKTLLN
jgi:hypothetical protein